MALARKLSKLIHELDQASMRSDIPAFRPGDTVKVHVKVVEGTRSRIQVFTSVVISRAGDGIREAFTVRKVSFGVGVERTFPCTARSSTRSKWNAAATYAGQTLPARLARQGSQDQGKARRQLIAGKLRYGEPAAQGEAAARFQPVDEPDQAEARDSDPEHLTFRQHVLAFFKELTAVVVGAVIVASLLRGFVGQMFLIPSVSMENTLRVEDRVVVEKLSPIERGEVIVFSDPGGWLIGTTARERGSIGKAFEFVGVLPDTGTEHLIKRVIGMLGIV